MIKNLMVALSIGVLLSACGGSDNKGSKSSSSKSSIVLVSSSAAAVSSTAPVSSVSSSMMSSTSSSESSSSESSSSESSSSAPSEVYDYNDFEAEEAGASFAVAGWDGNAPASGVATIVNIADITGVAANGDSVKAVKFVPANWNSGIKLTFTIPEGKTLADYNIVFDTFLPRTLSGFTGGDNNYYKDLMMNGGTTVSNLNPDGADALGVLPVGLFDQVDVWATQTFEPDETIAATITGTFELGIGINRPAAAAATDFYLIDNVGLELK